MSRLTMKIAMLISGRAARYEMCLLPILESCNNGYEIDLFMSINDEDSLYYKVMREKLAKYLKGVYINKYKLPEGFTYTHSGSRWNFQLINGEYMPYNIMSMFWNDHNAFEMAVQYAKENNIHYDLFMKFRSDIAHTSIPELMKFDDETFHLFSIFPSCHFTSNGIYKVPIISDAWVWGNYKSMKVYCNAYDYILRKNKETNGAYFICFESSNTDNVVENNLHYTYVKHPYKLDAHRRIFDKLFERNERGEVIGGDIRSGQLKECHNYINPDTVTTTEHIPIVPLT